MKSSEKINELTKAMSELQSNLHSIYKDTKAYNYKYATLASIWDSFRPFLKDLGLFIFQDVVTTDEGVKVSTRILHTSDQWIETDYILIPMGKKDPHSTGSACSYGRRYSLSCALGIVTSDEDDDGNKAQESSKNLPQDKISEADVKRIEDLINGDDDIKQKLLNWAQITKLSDLPLRLLKTTLTNLENKRKTSE